MSKMKFNAVESYTLPDVFNIELWRGDLTEAEFVDKQLWWTIYVTMNNATRVISLKDEAIARGLFGHWKGQIIMNMVDGKATDLNLLGKETAA